MSAAPEAIAYRRVRELFERLVELGPVERAEELDAFDDARVRDEVARMLAADAADVDLDAAARLRLPERLGPYRVIRELGRGGTGVVFEAEEAAPRRRVALKTVHPWLRTPALLELVRREAQALADIRHVGIPQVYALLEVDGAPVVSMELVRGVPITTYAASRPWRDRVALLAAVCEAVATAHAAGIVHRDLKPENVLVDEAGQPKVLDFGIAWHPDGAPPAGSGTAGWMAPEQRAGAPATPASDVWSLGLVGWEVLAGEGSIDDTEATPRPARGVREDVAAVLTRATAVDPARRYPDAAALASDLRRALADRTVDALSHAPTAPLRAAARRHPLLAGLALLGLLAAASAPLTVPWLDRRLAEAGAAARLAAAQRDPRGPDHPDVRAALAALLQDPDALGTWAVARAWTWRAAHTDGEERLDALVAAWALSPGDDPVARDALARALLSEGRVDAAAALGPATDPGLRGALALARWDLASDDVEPQVRAWTAPLTSAAPAPSSAFARIAGGLRWWDDGAGTLARDDGARWPIPGRLSSVEVRDGRVALRGGTPAWAATGALDDATATLVRLDGPSSDVALADPDGDGALDLLVARREGDAGVWRVVDGVLRPLHAGTVAQRLPVKDLEVGDLDGDGRDEVILAASGWRAQEVRVLSDRGAGLVVAGRHRLTAFGVAIGRDADGPVLDVLAAPLPDRPQPLVDPDRVVRFRWTGDALVEVATVRLDRAAWDIRAVDLDGDGRTEVVVDGHDHVELAAPGQRPGAVTLPGLRLVDAGQADGDPASELWVDDGARAWLLGVEGSPLAPRPAPSPAVPPPPAGLGDAFRQAAWARLAALAARGAADHADAALLALVGDRLAAPGVADALLELLDAPGPAAEAVARRLLATPALAATAREHATEVLRRAHVTDRPGAPPPVRLGFVAPLGPAWEVVAPEAVRRDPLAGRLDLELRGDTGVAVAATLSRDGPLACVEVDVELVEVDWAAGLDVALRQGAWSATARTWRVGGGPREHHRLSVSVADGGGRNVPYAPGPHTVSLCVDEAPSRASVALDGGPRTFTALPPLPPLSSGPLRLELGPSGGEGYDDDRRAHVRVVEVRLRGLAIEEGGGDPAARAVAEHDPVALDALLARGAPLARARAAAELDRPLAPLLPSLSPSARRALLRSAPSTWVPLLVREGRDDVAALWLDAWAIPLAYDDPWSTAALLEPGLAEVALGGPEASAFELARARALLGAGRVAAASARLDRLGHDDPEAELLRIRLRARLGHAEEAGTALRAWLAASASPEAALDRVTDDPELAALVPERAAVAALRR